MLLFYYQVCANIVIDPNMVGPENNCCFSSNTSSKRGEFDEGGTFFFAESKMNEREISLFALMIL